MYKDKSQQKAANRLAAQKRRAKGMTQSNTLKDSNTQNVIPEVIPWYPNKKTDSKGNPITPVTLSDGQLFYPDPTVKKIKEAKVKTYKCPPIIEALGDPIKRKKLESITQCLRKQDRPNVRYGLSNESVTFDIVEKYLACLT